MIIQSEPYDYIYFQSCILLVDNNVPWHIRENLRIKGSSWQHLKLKSRTLPSSNHPFDFDHFM